MIGLTYFVFNDEYCEIDGTLVGIGLRREEQTLKGT